MNWFDYWIIHFLNSFAQRWWIADAFVVQLSKDGFQVAGVLMTIFWWVWMKHGKEDVEKRVTLLANLFLIAFAVLVARVLAAGLPYRERPLRDPVLHFQLPFTANPESLIHWSSFPSDHAVVIFCLATGLWMTSRRLGAWALAYAALISLPRVYVGAHYPSDILAGALLGMGIAFLAYVPSLRRVGRTLLGYLEPHPAFLYCFLFAWTDEIGEMFDSLRRFGLLGLKVALRCPRGQVEDIAFPLLLAGLLCVWAWLVWLKRTPGPQRAARSSHHHG